MSQHRFFKSPLMFPFLSLGLLWNALVSIPASAAEQVTFSGEPDSTSLSPHVVFPDLGTIPWPIDCSQWPEDPPDDGYLASIFGHRLQSGNVSGRALVRDWIDGSVANNGLMIHGDSGENYQQKIESDDTSNRRGST